MAEATKHLIATYRDAVDARAAIAALVAWFLSGGASVVTLLAGAGFAMAGGGLGRDLLSTLEATHPESIRAA